MIEGESWRENSLARRWGWRFRSDFMVRKIVLYPDPVLREKGRLVTEVTPEILTLADDMLETMRDARGVGLAAQQVGEAIQLAVVDVSHDEECIIFLNLNGEDRPLASIMPLVFINPVLEFGKRKETDIEGCLSFPDLRADVTRPGTVKARLQTLEGEKLVIETDGLLSRAIQHEVDHLMGKLFIDRMSTAKRMSLRRILEDMREGRY